MSIEACIPADVLTPSMRVRARLSILGWTLETLGAARAAREDRSLPYTESTVRGWLKRMDEGGARKSTMDAIAKTIGVNAASFFFKDNPIHLATSPTKGYSFRKIMRSREHYLPAGLGWPEMRFANNGNSILDRINTALVVRGITKSELAKQLGMTRSRMWRVFRKIKSWCIKGWFTFGSSLPSHKKLGAFVEKIAAVLKLEPTDFYASNSKTQGWVSILDKRVDKTVREDYEPKFVYRPIRGGIDLDAPKPPKHPGDIILDMIHERIKVLGMSFPRWVTFLDAVQHYNMRRSEWDIRRELREQYENELFLHQIAESLMMDGPEGLEDSERGRELRTKIPGHRRLKLYDYRVNEFVYMCPRDQIGRRQYSDQHDVLTHGSPAQIEEWATKATAFINPSWSDNSGTKLSDVDGRDRFQMLDPFVVPHPIPHGLETDLERKQGFEKRPLWPMLRLPDNRPDTN